MMFGIGKKPPYVLHIDDDASERLLIGELLEVLGYEVLSAESVQAGQEAAKSRTPALILLDVMMPLVDGFTACGHFRREPALKAIPIVMLTSLDRVADVDRAFAAGATDYLTKPLKLERLRDKLLKHIGAPPPK